RRCTSGHEPRCSPTGFLGVASAADSDRSGFSDVLPGGRYTGRGTGAAPSWRVLASWRVIGPSAGPPRGDGLPRFPGRGVGEGRAADGPGYAICGDVGSGSVWRG